MKTRLLILVFALLPLFGLAQNLVAQQDSDTYKWGFLNNKGEWAIKPVFEEVNRVFSTNQSFANVKYRGKWGCVDRSGNWVVRAAFTHSNDAYYAGLAWEKDPAGFANRGLYAQQDDNTRKWGFLNNKGEWAIQPVFEEVNRTFSSNQEFANVQYKGKWGCINRKGEWVIRPSFSGSDGAYSAGLAWEKNPTPPLAGESFGVVAASAPVVASKPIATQPSSQPASYTAAQPTTQPTTEKLTPPIVKILSPQNGGTYASAEVTLSVDVKTSNNVPFDFIVVVDGEKIENGTHKGVKKIGNELKIPLPQNTSKSANIQLIAKDANGMSSDPVFLKLSYVGDKPKPNLILLAVGVSNYHQSDLKLTCAANDAQDFVATVKQLNTSQYANVVVSSVLTDEQATDRAIRKAVSQTVRDAAQEDVVMLFFSGHGSKEGEEYYFLPVNAESQDLYATAVNFREITSAATALKDKACKVVLFMDACHSGALVGSKSADLSPSLALPGVTTFTSSTKGQLSKEVSGWRNGLFTKYLLDGLKGEAANKNGAITLDDLGHYIRRSVSEKDKSQSPLYENHQQSFMLFSK